jgi:hypothetical protein
MGAMSALFSSEGLRRLFTSQNTALERRVRSLPVAVERRGPRCAQCGFGTLHLIPADREDGGRLRCDRPGCGLVCDQPTATAAA